MNGFQQSLIRFMYVALVLVLVLAGWSLLRPSAAAASAAQWDPSRGPQGVTATGTCVVRTNPEVVEVNLGVSQSSTTASAAKSYVKDTCAKIIAVAEAAGEDQYLVIGKAPLSGHELVNVHELACAACSFEGKSRLLIAIGAGCAHDKGFDFIHFSTSAGVSATLL